MQYNPLTETSQKTRKMDSEMMHAVEENSAEFLLAMGRAGGGEERNAGGIQWTVGGSPLDYHNAVVRANLTLAACDAEIEAFQNALIANNVPGSWHLGPSMRPETLGKYLLARGFSDDGDDLGMGLDLSLPPSAMQMPQALEIVPVRTRQQLADYADVLAQGFGEGEREARWVQEVFATTGLDADSPWQHLVGYVDAVAVTTATLFFTREIVGLYFIATVPLWRRQGLGAAITLRALQAARQRGARWAVLCASAMGASVYRRIGFSELATIRIFTWRPPALSFTS